jgi:hypothetical protein
VRGETAFSKDEDGKGGNDGEEGEDEFEDLQAGHGSHEAGIMYARGMFEMDGVVASRRQHFERAAWIGIDFWRYSPPWR